VAFNPFDVICDGVRSVGITRGDVLGSQMLRNAIVPRLRHIILLYLSHALLATLSLALGNVVVLLHLVPLIGVACSHWSGAISLGRLLLLDQGLTHGLRSIYPMTISAFLHGGLILIIYLAMLYIFGHNLID
jgi:hypothetical protein